MNAQDISLATGTHYDIAIIGAGISGCYAAYRLLKDPKTAGLKVGLFEHSNRVGGRLYSLEAPKLDLPLEMGGMFLKPQHQITFDLCRHFDLNLSPVRLVPYRYYLRGRMFDREPVQAVDFPYDLAPNEQKQPHWMLLYWAIKQAVPQLEQGWPYRKSVDKRETILHLRSQTLLGQKLYDWSFSALLKHFLSAEAYQLLVDGLSTVSVLGDWNAYDAIVCFLGYREAGWYRLQEGYQQLPEKLSTGFIQSNGELHLRHELISISTLPDKIKDSVAYELQFKQLNHKQPRISASRIILALPKAALKQIKLIGLNPSDQFEAGLDTVDSVAATKAYLVFDHAWWKTQADTAFNFSNDNLVVSHTDLPLKQCYYLGEDRGTGRGLLLAAFLEGWTAEAWAKDSSGQYVEQTELTAQPCSDEMLKQLLRQLALLHQTEVPQPVYTAYIDWNHRLFGGGLHLWKPQIRSWEVSKSMQRPFGLHQVFVCGETFSLYQGWVEGALTSTENLLCNELQLLKPDWLVAQNSMLVY